MIRLARKLFLLGILFITSCIFQMNCLSVKDSVKSPTANADYTKLKVQYAELKSKYLRLKAMRTTPFDGGIIKKIPLKKRSHKKGVAKKRRFRNPLDGVMGIQDKARTARDYNRALRSMYSTWQKHRRIVTRYKRFRKPYNSTLKKRNKLMASYSKHRKLCLKKEAGLLRRHPYLKRYPLFNRTVPNKVVAYVDNSYLADASYIPRPKLKYERRKRSVSEGRYSIMASVDDKIDRGYRKLKKDLSSARTDHKAHLSSIRKVKRCLKLWVKRYNALVEVEKRLKNSTVRLQLDLCSHISCMVPSYLK